MLVTRWRFVNTTSSDFTNAQVYKAYVLTGASGSLLAVFLNDRGFLQSSGVAEGNPNFELVSATECCGETVVFQEEV